MEPNAKEPDWKLLTLANESKRIQAKEATAALLELASTGGFPQGARPKALVHYDVKTGHVSPASMPMATPG